MTLHIHISIQIHIHIHLWSCVDNSTCFASTYLADSISICLSLSLSVDHTKVLLHFQQTEIKLKISLKIDFAAKASFYYSQAKRPTRLDSTQLSVQLCGQSWPKR